MQAVSTQTREISSIAPCLSGSSVFGDTSTLRQLLAQLDRTPGRISLRLLRGWMQRFRPRPSELQPFVRFGEDRYQRNRVALTENYEMLVLCWRPGQRSPIHDHGGSNCAILVLAGEATEVRFVHDAHGGLQAVSAERLATGRFTASADADLHLIANATSPAQDLVTLHIYSRPLIDMRTYGEDRINALDLLPVRMNGLIRSPSSGYMDGGEGI